MSSQSIERLAENLAAAHPGFDAASFAREANDGLEVLELSERVRHIATVMHRHLPADFVRAIGGIVRTLPTWNRGDKSDVMRGFASWPVFEYVARHGLDEADVALDALAKLTHLFTGEFAVRPFLERDLDGAMRHFRSWAKSEDEQVRRLSSEGLRPRLPWASRLPALIADPSPALALLEFLKDDPSLYVRKSVGNHLSDIAVDHPELVLQLCKRWIESPSATDERRWIVRRATRNLIKSGHPDVWELHGFAKNPRIHLDGFSLSSSSAKLGERVRMDLSLCSQADQRVAIDYVVHHVKARGETSEKVFKWKEVELSKGQELRLQKFHAFRKISTRVYYSGAHLFEIQINGKRFTEGRETVDLRVR